MPCNEYCPFCQHHPVTVNQLYRAWVRASKFGLVTICLAVFKAASYLICNENRGVNSGKWKWLLGTYFSSFKSKIILLRVCKKLFCTLNSQQRVFLRARWLRYFTFHVTYITRRVWCNAFFLSSVQFSSVAQSCPTICDSMSCSTPELPFVNSLKKSPLHEKGAGLFFCWLFLSIPETPHRIRRDTCRRDP